MICYTATTRIYASPEAIWKVLIDAPGYPKWDPGVDRIEGTIAAGSQVTAFTKRDPKRGFPAKVSEFAPPHKMTWTGGMPLGLFKGVRTFTLTPKEDGSVEFTLREEFSGLLLPLFAGTIPDLTKSFEDFAAGLKAFTEKA